MKLRNLSLMLVLVSICQPAFASGFNIGSVHIGVPTHLPELPAIIPFTGGGNGTTVFHGGEASKRNCTGTITIHNNTGVTMPYNMGVTAGQTDSLQGTNWSIVKPCDSMSEVIYFDSSYEPGAQTKSYTVFSGDSYQFIVTGDGKSIDLHKE